jgi:hypothetical protein
MHGLRAVVQATWLRALIAACALMTECVQCLTVLIAAQGPVYALEVSGGACTEDTRSGRVTCSQPRVALTKTAGGCNLPYTGPAVVQARSHAICLCGC